MPENCRYEQGISWNRFCGNKGAATYSFRIGWLGLTANTTAPACRPAYSLLERHYAAANRHHLRNPRLLPRPLDILLHRRPLDTKPSALSAAERCRPIR